ncbi:hypothetical protein EBQ90_01955 [bacterium]|nr:hypothetical protein [bacterium]
MKRLLSVFCWSSVLFGILSFGFDGGSDGPTPFSKISAPKKLLIPTKRAISAFAILEKTEQVAYLDVQGELRLNDVRSGKEKALGHFLPTLLPISDPTEKFLISRNLRSLKELKAEGQARELQLPVANDFLFWNDDQLFLSKKLEKTGKGKWQLGFHRVNLAKNLVIHHHCDFQLPPEVTNLTVAQGHRHPKVLMYQVENHGESTRLTFFQLGLRLRDDQCEVETLGSQNVLRAQVQSVAQVGKENFLAVITDHAEENLYFGFPGAFKSTQLPLGVSYIPNPERPVVVNLNRKKGVGVYSLETEKYFTLDIALDRGLLFGNQIWVTSDGGSLYLSTRDSEDGRGERSLHMLTLEGLY